MKMCEECGRVPVEAPKRLCPECAERRKAAAREVVKQRMRMEEKPCQRCGAPLPIPHGAGQQYCKACQKAAKVATMKKVQKIYAGRMDTPPAPKPRPKRTWPKVTPRKGMSIGEIVRGAEQEGISYGEYTVRHGV